MFKKLALLVLCLNFLITGCKTVGVDTAEKANIKNILVVSSFGPTMDYIYRGLSVRVFGAQYQRIDASHINLDGFSRNYVVSALQAKGYNAASMNIAANDFYFSETELENLLTKAQAENYDTLVAMDSSTGLPVGRAVGYGLYTQDSLGTYTHNIYNGLKLKVYNVKTGDLIGQSVGYNTLNGSPFYVIDIENQENFMDLTDLDKETVFTAIKSNTQRMIDYALEDIKI